MLKPLVAVQKPDRISMRNLYALRLRVAVVRVLAATNRPAVTAGVFPPGSNSEVNDAKDRPFL
jgi:hypothetical protein